MSIPHVFSPVRPQDYTITPITVHKQYVIQRSDLYNGSTPITSSGYKILEARHTNEKLKLGTDRTYPTNSFDGSNQHIVWSQLDAMYYRFPNDPVATMEHSNRRYTYKNLNISASIIQIPQHDFGEGIKPGSVQFTCSIGIDDSKCSDDGYGNLYLAGTPLYDINNNFITSSVHQVVNWHSSIHNRISKFKNLLSDNTFRNLSDTAYYDLNVAAKTYPLRTFYKNIYHLESVATTTSNFTWSNPFYFPPDKVAYIRTEHNNDLNLVGDFTISFWFKCNIPMPATVFIDKSKIATKIKNENFNKTVDGVVYKSNISSSVDYSPTPVYPYRFSINSAGKIVFTRSNGISAVSLVTSDKITETDEFQSFVVTKRGTQLSLYVNGNLEDTETDINETITNNNDLMFGSCDFTSSIYNESNNAFDKNGLYLDDVRFFNTALSTGEVGRLVTYSNVSHQVGNIFYKSGKIVLTNNFIRSDLLAFDFILKYRNTHTIYQYETLCRIKPGDFNLSQNPTTRQTPYSDLLINEMTSSVADGGMPIYATTVGLYNDSGELLVIGKLGQALKMREDVPINLIIRFDT